MAIIIVLANQAGVHNKPFLSCFKQPQNTTSIMRLKPSTILNNLNIRILAKHRGRVNPAVTTLARRQLPLLLNNLPLLSICKLLNYDGKLTYFFSFKRKKHYVLQHICKIYRGRAGKTCTTASFACHLQKKKESASSFFFNFVPLKKNETIYTHRKCLRFLYAAQ